MKVVCVCYGRKPVKEGELVVWLDCTQPDLKWDVPLQYEWRLKKDNIFYQEGNVGILGGKKSFLHNISSNALTKAQFSIPALVNVSSMLDYMITYIIKSKWLRSAYTIGMIQSICALRKHLTFSKVNPLMWYFFPIRMHVEQYSKWRLAQTNVSLCALSYASSYAVLLLMFFRQVL